MTNKVPYVLIGCVLLFLFSTPLAYFSSKALAFLPFISVLFLLTDIYRKNLLLHMNIIQDQVFIVFALLISIALIGSFNAPSPDISFERTFKLSFLLLSGLILIHALVIIDTIQYKKIWRIIPLLYLFFLLLVVIDLTVLRGWIFHTIRGHRADQNNPLIAMNWVVLCYICFLWPILALTWHDRRFLLFLALVILAGLMVIFGESQAALIGYFSGLIAMMMAYAFQKNRYSLRILSSVGLLILLFLLPTFILENIDINQKLETIDSAFVQNIIQRSSAGGRLEIWQVTSAYIMQKPLFGWGMDAIRSLELPNKGFFLQQNWQHATHPHNAILQIWLDLGLLGILLTSSFLIYLLKQIEKLPPHTFLMSWALLGSILSISTVGYSLWQGWWQATIFIACAMIIIFSRLPKVKE